MKLALLVQLAPLFTYSGLNVAQTVNNGSYARDLGAQVVRSPFGLCWRPGQWRPEEAVAECDPELVPKPEPKPAPAAVVAAPPRQPEPKLEPAPPPPVAKALEPAAAPVRAKQQAITLGADAAFDTGKADL